MKKILLIAGLLASVIWLSACSLTPASDDIINPDADYVYFFGKTCPHCQEMNAWMEENDIHSKYAIEKREVYFNPENGAAFQAVTNALWLEGWSVPFMLRKSDNEYRIGVEPVKKLFAEAELEGITSEEEAIYEEISTETIEEVTQ